MIYLIKKLLFLTFLCFVPINLWAYNSSNFLISQSAFKNQDYSFSLLNFQEFNENLPNSILTDKMIAAIITEDISSATKIADKILINHPKDQEANIVKVSDLYIDKNFNKINSLVENYGDNNGLIEHIFYDNSQLRNSSKISNALIDIVVSSFSNSDNLSLNYDFLMFYISLAKLIEPENDRAILIKGELFQNLKKDSIARKIFELIQPNSQYYLDAQKSLAYNYSTFLSFDEAQKKILELLDNTNNNYFINKVLADFYRFNKKYDLAISLYDILIEENREDLYEIFYMRGICYERLGNWKKAEKDFLLSLSIEPDVPNILNYLAYGWVEREINLDKSLSMLKKAYEKNPESFYIIDSLGWAHFKKNNLEEAANLMEKVIDIAPGEAISLDHLGDIYYAMNRKREAIYFWQQALELAEPEDEIEQSIRSKLNKFNAG